LAGTDIPLAARVVAIADVYDALRSRRVYKPALSHGAALQVMLESSPGQFDPVLLQTFQRHEHEFELLRAAARKRVAEKYSWEAVTSAYESLWQRLATN
jgi:HD-GYP domain-containing protein (c-di-GMP phosphodiesterase class II)